GAHEVVADGNGFPNVAIAASQAVLGSDPEGALTVLKDGGDILGDEVYGVEGRLELALAEFEEARPPGVSSAGPYMVIGIDQDASHVDLERAVDGEGCRPGVGEAFESAIVPMINAFAVVTNPQTSIVVLSNRLNDGVFGSGKDLESLAFSSVQATSG